MQPMHAEQSTGSQWRLAFKTGGAVVALLLITACGNADGPADSIAMGRDVVIDGITSGATLTALPGGGFVVAGDSWAVATDVNGGVLWRYPDRDLDPTAKTNPQSEFHGVVPLSNGDILLCGVERTGHDSAALLTKLNNAGQLVEKRLIQPPGPGEYHAARFDRCFRWDDGFAVTGSVAKANARFDWLMKLDGTGAKQWELFDYRLTGIEGVETLNHNLVMASNDITSGSTKLIQVNPQGHIVSTKNIPGFANDIVRSAVPTSTVKVITNVNRENSEVFTFNDKFEQIAPPWPVKFRVTADSCFWLLRDGSIAVFGHVFAQPGTDRSSVAHIAMRERQDEMRAFTLPNPQSTSTRTYDAVPTSERTFVAVRALNNSVALSWVTIKQ